MGDSLQNILSDKSFNEPKEFAIIRQFVQDNFDKIPELQIQNHTIVIKVKGSGLAGSLQLRLHELKDRLPKNTKVRIQII